MHLTILRGNLAPNTGITKPAAIVPEMHRFAGQARCFDARLAESADKGAIIRHKLE
jgi:dihydroxy-acid dehydratase